MLAAMSSAHAPAPLVARCPWCGLTEIVPHGSDAACIAALQDAIRLHHAHSRNRLGGAVHNPVEAALPDWTQRGNDQSVAGSPHQQGSPFRLTPRLKSERHDAA
jgi:hypothetical protein